MAWRARGGRAGDEAVREVAYSFVGVRATPFGVWPCSEDRMDYPKRTDSDEDNTCGPPGYLAGSEGECQVCPGRQHRRINDRCGKRLVDHAENHLWAFDELTVRNTQ